MARTTTYLGRGVARRPRAVGLVAATFAVAGLAACGGGGGSQVQTSLDDSTQVTLQFAHWGGEETWTGDYADRVAAFEELHPNITIDPLTVADDYDTKITTLVNSGQAPELMQVAENGTKFSQAFTDLTPYIEAAGMDLTTEFGNAAEMYNDGTIQFAVPDRGGSTVLYYNKDLFDAAGLEYPDEDYTMAQYYSDLEKITALSGTVDVDGDGTKDEVWGGTATGYQAIWGAFLLGNGGSIIELDDAGDPTVTVDSAQNVATLEEYVGAYKSGWILPSENTVDKGGDAWFKEGKIGMNMTGFWNVQSYGETTTLNWDLSTIPLGTEEAGWPMGSGIAVSADASDEEKAAAWEFISYMSGDEGQGYLAETLGDLPASLEALSSLEYTATNGNAINVSVISQVQKRLTRIDGYVRGPWYSEVNTEAGLQVDKALETDLSVADMLADMQVELTKVVNRY